MLISLIRSVLLYLILIAVIRLMGKRQIGQMEAPEFVVTMLIADLASVPMQNNGISLFSGLIPILAVLALELILAGSSMRWLGVRRVLCGKPVILIENGKISQRNLARTRVTLDELTGRLRAQGVMDLGGVNYAILETDGQISVFPYAKNQPASASDLGLFPDDPALPYTVVSDGRVLEENLALAGRDLQWLEGELSKRACALGDVFVLTVDGTGQVYFCKKEGPQ